MEMIGGIITTGGGGEIAGTGRSSSVRSRAVAGGPSLDGRSDGTLIVVGGALLLSSPLKTVTVAPSSSMASSASSVVVVVVLVMVGSVSD